MNTDFWVRLHEATDRFVEGGKMYDPEPTPVAEALGDSNMPKVVPTATVGTCLACSYLENHPTLWYPTAEPNQELGNGLCSDCWSDCVDKMPHFAPVDPDFEIWKELCQFGGYENYRSSGFSW